MSEEIAIDTLSRLIDRCKECKFATCENCEISWNEVQSIKGLLDLYDKEKKKNKDMSCDLTETKADNIDELTMLKQIKLKLQEKNIPIETLLAEFNRLEDLEDDKEQLIQENKELEEKLQQYKKIEEIVNTITDDEIRNAIKNAEKDYILKSKVKEKIDFLKEVLAFAETGRDEKATIQANLLKNIIIEMEKLLED